MKPAWLGALLLALLAAPAVAQAPASSDVEDLRPKDMRFPDSMGMVELPIGPVPTDLSNPGPGTTSEDALSISGQIFGKRVDDAYGAYQRGYYLTALNLATPRAEAGDAPSQTLLGEIYGKGLGVAQDLKTAARWYELASENGDPLATFELAMMFQEGSGVTRDRKRAAELFKAAADAGNMMAKYNLGLLHIEGIYAQPSLTKAAALLKEAAEAGIPEAEYDYGGMLMEGAGVAPDPKAAAELYKQAATAGLIGAQVDYATLLYLGKGVDRDRPGAVKWYRRAAEAGNAVAQNRLAKLIAAGDGTDLNLEDAAMWRALARRQGLTDPMLDKLLVSILPADLSRAEERARFWPSDPPTKVADSGPAPAATPKPPSP